MALTLGSEFVFASSSSEVPVVRALSDDKFVVAWRDAADADKGKMCVGTKSGTNIAYGPVLTFTTGVLNTAPHYDYARQTHDVAVLDDGKVLVTYVLNTLYSYGVVCTVTGDTLSLGTPQIYTGLGNKTKSVCCAAFTDTTALWVVDYENTWNGQHIRCRVVTVTGTTISLGAENAVNVGYNDNMREVAIDEDRAIITYGRQRVVATKYVRATVYTRSGTTLTRGGDKTIYSLSAGPWEPRENELTVLSSDTVAKLAMAYNFSDDLRVAYISTSGTSRVIDVNDEVLLTSNSIYLGALVTKDEDEFDILYTDLGDSDYGKVVHGTITPTGTLSFDSDETFHAGAMADNHACAIGYPISVVAYRDTGNSNYGTARIVQLEEIIPVETPSSASGHLVMSPGGHQAFASSFYPSNWRYRNG